jgi:hypothetical protein
MYGRSHRRCPWSKGGVTALALGSPVHKPKQHSNYPGGANNASRGPASVLANQLLAHLRTSRRAAMRCRGATGDASSLPYVEESQECRPACSWTKLQYNSARATADRVGRDNRSSANCFPLARAGACRCGAPRLAGSHSAAQPVRKTRSGIAAPRRSSLYTHRAARGKGGRFAGFGTLVGSSLCDSRRNRRAEPLGVLAQSTRRCCPCYPFGSWDDSPLGRLDLRPPAAGSCRPSSILLVPALSILQVGSLVLCAE